MEDIHSVDVLLDHTVEHIIVAYVSSHIGLGGTEYVIMTRRIDM